MRYLAATMIFLVATVLGFGVGSYRATAFDEFVARSIACEVVKQAVSKGYAADRDKLIDAISVAPNATPLVRSAVLGVRRSKSC